MFFDDKGQFNLEKKEFVYLVATAAAVIAAVAYEIYMKKRNS